MLLQDKQVAIIGAGPVGLMMARLLQQQGVNIAVYERDKDPEARIWGGTLDLHKDSGQKAMEKASLLNNYYAMALPMGIIMANERGKVLSIRKPTEQNKYDNPEINRNDLRKILLGSLTANTVTWDSKCTGLEKKDDKWLLRFENKPDATADLLIEANGGMSKIRDYVTDARVEETGTFIIQGEVPGPELNCPEFYRFCNGNRLMTSYGGYSLVANPYNNGSLSYGVMFTMPEEWRNGHGPDFRDTENTIAFLLGKLSGWGEVYRKLFQSTAFFVGLPTKVLPLHKPWNNDRPLPITLIGDAAHLMPPFAGKGVNTGLVDAWILAHNLTAAKFDTIDAAISDYEKQMFVYATAAQLESGVNEKQMRDPGFSFGMFVK